MKASLRSEVKQVTSYRADQYIQGMHARPGGCRSPEQAVTLRPPYAPAGFWVAKSMKCGCGRTISPSSGTYSSRLSSSSLQSNHTTSYSAIRIIRGAEYEVPARVAACSWNPLLICSRGLKRKLACAMQPLASARQSRQHTWCAAIL